MTGSLVAPSRRSIAALGRARSGAASPSVLATFVAGVRWCWIGRMRPRREGCCGRCPECGTGFAASHPGTQRSGFLRRFEGLTFLRALLDLPGLLLMSYPAFVVTLFLLVILGVIEID